MNLSEEHKAACFAAIKVTYEKAKGVWKREFPLPGVVFAHLGMVGGRATYRENVIEIHPGFVEQNFEDYIRQTIPHECAHLIAYQLHGVYGKGHGEIWKAVMMQLGVPPDRCHDYDCTMMKKGNPVQKAHRVEY